jgi:hypothetical protein
MCIKQQIKSFLLQYNLPEPEGLATWTLRSLRCLREMSLGPELRFTLDVLPDELDYLLSQLHRMDKNNRNNRGQPRMALPYIFNLGAQFNHPHNSYF